MRRGQIITVEGFDHEFVQCRFVRLQGQTAIVCGEQEWLLAEKEKREPVCIGFPLKNVRDRGWADIVRLAAKDKPYAV
jgi:hypothetical protein